MIFETKNGRYWPIDSDAEHATERYHMLPPMDWQSYEAMKVFLREAGETLPELYDPENPFNLSSDPATCKQQMADMIRNTQPWLDAATGGKSP